MEIMRWCLQAQKTRFQLRILNVPLGKSHIWFITPYVKIFFQVCKGTGRFENVKNDLHFGA